MCAIFGFISAYGACQNKQDLNYLISSSHERGRDGRGFRLFCDGYKIDYKNTTRAHGSDWNEYSFPPNRFTVIGNTRAEPTTEFVKEKKLGDQQPYSAGKWTIVHNGTIANDKELRTGVVPTSIDSAAIAELLDSTPMAGTDKLTHFTDCVRKLRGSYAILAVHSDNPGVVFAACNYRPIWWQRTEAFTAFSSTRGALPHHHISAITEMFPPYSTGAFTATTTEIRIGILYPAVKKLADTKCLVVCSGGMDSVVAASLLKSHGYDIELLHFQYGCRAEGPEHEAVIAAANALGCALHFMPLPIYNPSDSPLLRADSTIAGGEAGAEFAHEWVPARNLVMLSIATAFAEANGFQYIGLGNNLEEAGAYPDNEPEFINKLNDTLPFAVGDGKRMRILMPVGNMMKHEIVEAGLRVGAPMDKTWSCYRAGKVHCGKCGPCHMRRTAFEINRVKDPMEYES